MANVSADFTIKRGDTWSPIEAILKDQSGPIDLTTASKVKMLLKSGSTLIMTGPVTIAPNQSTNETGKVTYEWEEGDTATIGTYNCEFEIEWESGKIESVPNGADGKLYCIVNIVQDLG